MIPLVADNKDAIVALCKRYGVRRLALFGSAATGAFDEATSVQKPVILSVAKDPRAKRTAPQARHGA